MRFGSVRRALGGVFSRRSYCITRNRFSSETTSMLASESTATAAKLGFGSLIARSEEHTSELQSQSNLVCRLLLEKKKKHRDIDSHRVEALSERSQFCGQKNSTHRAKGEWHGRRDSDAGEREGPTQR